MSDMSTPVPFLLEVLSWGLRECSLLQLVFFVFQKKQITFLKTSGHKCIIVKKKIALQERLFRVKPEIASVVVMQ